MAVRSRIKNKKGFSPVAIIIVAAALLVAGGGLVHQQSKKAGSEKNSINNSMPSDTHPPSAPLPSAEPSDPYANWKAAKLASEKLSFRYPADWTMKGSADNISVSSPVADNHYFEIGVAVSADTRDVDLNALGNLGRYRYWILKQNTMEYHYILSQARRLLTKRASWVLAWRSLRQV